MSKPVSALQLRRLQTLYSAAISRELGADGSREARIAWASNNIGRTIGSFRDLTSSEANALIDNLQMELGQPVAEKIPRRILDRDRAQAAGTEGRRAGPRATVTLASQDDLRRVHDAVARLSWTEEQFEHWLHSRTSPLKGAQTIRTLADANRVWWALKNILKREGKWRQIA